MVGTGIMGWRVCFWAAFILLCFVQCPAELLQCFCVYCGIYFSAQRPMSILGKRLTGRYHSSWTVQNNILGKRTINLMFSHLFTNWAESNGRTEQLMGEGGVVDQCLNVITPAWMWCNVIFTSQSSLNYLSLIAEAIWQQVWCLKS